MLKDATQCTPTGQPQLSARCRHARTVGPLARAALVRDQGPLNERLASHCRRICGRVGMQPPEIRCPGDSPPKEYEKKKEKDMPGVGKERKGGRPVCPRRRARRRAPGRPNEPAPFPPLPPAARARLEAARAPKEVASCLRSENDHPRLPSVHCYRIII